MKHLNGEKQMKSVWNIGLCIGNERIKDEAGKKAHTTQKPEKLLLNVILSSSKIGDIVLDPFMGSGTSGAIAKLTGRNFIGIEREANYRKVAQKRIDGTTTEINNPIFTNQLDIKPPRVPIEKLIKKGYLKIGEPLFTEDEQLSFLLTSTGTLLSTNKEFSIHKLASQLLNKPKSNGWDFWMVQRNKKLISIDKLRTEYLKNELDFETIII
jgi:site-specific DNA-methyltransferase (adenine-specific)